MAYHPFSVTNNKHTIIVMVSSLLLLLLNPAINQSQRMTRCLENLLTVE